MAFFIFNYVRISIRSYNLASKCLTIEQLICFPEKKRDIVKVNVRKRKERISVERK